MPDRERKRTIISYIAGSLLLAAALVLALSMPALFGLWQDRRRESTAVFLNRPALKPLSSADLDIASRMRLLGETRQVSLVGISVRTEGYWYSESTLEDLRGQVEAWVKNGLLPRRAAYLLDGGSLAFLMEYALILDGETYLPLSFLIFEDGANTLTLLGDREKNILYYAAFTGTGAEKEILGLFGLRTLREAEQIRDGSYAMPHSLVLSRFWDISDQTLREKTLLFDAAAVCGAEESHIVNEAFVYRDMDVVFDDFAGMAYRRLCIQNNGRPGICVSLGLLPYRWMNDEVLMSQGGFGEWGMSLVEAFEEVPASGRESRMFDRGVQQEIEITSLLDMASYLS